MNSISSLNPLPHEEPDVRPETPERYRQTPLRYREVRVTADEATRPLQTTVGTLMECGLYRDVFATDVVRPPMNPRTGCYEISLPDRNHNVVKKALSSMRNKVFVPREEWPTTVDFVEYQKLLDFLQVESADWVHPAPLNQLNVQHALSYLSGINDSRSHDICSRILQKVLEAKGGKLDLPHSSLSRTQVLLFLTLLGLKFEIVEPNDPQSCKPPSISWNPPGAASTQ